MKKLITIFVLFLYAGIAQAQTEAETLEWLNAKKVEVSYSSSHTVDGGNKYDNELIVNSIRIELKNKKGAESSLIWSEIKDFKVAGSRVTIVSNRMYEGRNAFIYLYINNEDIAPKYVKALKHMATLKGAKLIDDNLFGN